MLIHKAYKFRMYPNNDQQELINKTFGCTRLVYNYYLNQQQELYKNEKLKNLSIREYECPECGNKLDRDYNAALNIMYEGLKKYMEELTA